MASAYRAGTQEAEKSTHRRGITEKHKQATGRGRGVGKASWREGQNRDLKDGRSLIMG